MTKDPMEKLRNDNKTRSESSKIYIREDLSKKRANVLYKARQLKKCGLIKDVFTRDGTIPITIRMPPIKPLGKDGYYRITNEEELKTFCSNSKLEVNSDCLPVTKGKLSSTYASIIVVAPSTSALPMESQDSQSDTGTFDEASSSKV